MRRNWTLLIFGLLLLFLGVLLPGAAQDSNISVVVPNPDGYPRANRLGIAHVSSAEVSADPTRYQNALLTGAGWTRYPIYWNRIEREAGKFTWDDYDRVVTEDMRYGINVNAILLGRPDFRADGNSIASLAAPIFADGSDVPGINKTINPNNPWAQWVFSTVERYKPGGTLAQQQGWQTAQGIRVWEIWNEPDLPQFWSAGIREYARLLKVAYLAAHHADPGATVMVGGLLYPTEENWLARILAIYQTEDVFFQRNNSYMDAVAVHSYAYPWRSGWLVLYARETLQAYGMRRPIWLNETGVSIWDDYPGPVWATDNGKSERLTKASAEQAGWYIIQSAAYAWAQGADKVFYHQLYDDCGDEPPGTTFPPHTGNLCTAGNICYGSAFGLYRNDSTSVCYNQHPYPGTPRPAAQAYRLLADVFGSKNFGRGQIERIRDITTITFEVPETSEIIHVIWNRKFEPNQYSLPARSEAGVLYTLSGTQTVAPDASGNYSVDLKAAQPDSFPQLERGDISAIGGEPVILVEVAEGALPPRPNEVIPVVQASNAAGGAILLDANAPSNIIPGAVTPTIPGVGAPVATYIPQVDGAGNPLPTPTFLPIVPELVRPTVAPQDDTTPPQTAIEALPEFSPLTFTVRWSGKDDSGIDRYIVWVQTNGADWQPWLETARTEGIYTGEPGNTYGFAIWAVDLASNWSENVELFAQAVTTVQ
jgi:hypothetical protein